MQSFYKQSATLLYNYCVIYQNLWCGNATIKKKAQQIYYAALAKGCLVILRGGIKWPKRLQPPYFKKVSTSSEQGNNKHTFC